MKCKLKLFIAGNTDLSRRATENLRSLQADQLDPATEVAIVDILENPEAAIDYRILATPVTVRVDCDPPRKALGDLSNSTRLFAALGLHKGSKQ